MPTLRAGFIGRLRSTSLQSYKDTMCQYDELAVSAESRNKLCGWKSEQMSDEERVRLYLMRGGIELGAQYLRCPRCQHTYFDGAPENATVDEMNLEDVHSYMQVCRQVRAWKKNKENVEQP